MANLSRFIGMASKVISKQMQQRGQGSAAASTGQQPQGGTDWRGMVRTAADKLTGDDRNPQQRPVQQRPQSQQFGAPQQRGPVDADKVALAKYDYLLRTASPEQLEQVHHDAFARLTPEQRQQVLQRMNTELPPHERPTDDSAQGMARAMTRGEVARPGLIRRVLGGGGTNGAGRSRMGAMAGGAAVGAGAMAIGGIAVAVAGGAIVSAAAGPVLAGAMDMGVDFEGIASGIGDLGLADLGEDLGGDLGAGVDGLSEQASGLGDHVSGLGEQASGLGEQASNLGNDLLGGLFDR
ncbi:hypothetical protein [Curtobacterium sp. MCBA15_001]|uniref:hypothetical protein n=1 Tax=Curtobacterium sp. MCBA15_001 TaxID=1898731 RepID=UPI0008DD506B|nr:hypothetical protein [Curtobacterium sp. MCBA15_001]OIH94430.1 hypothetical protein BIU90_04625 [Curtobacterium sp. MCBA15_001]